VPAGATRAVVVVTTNLTHFQIRQEKLETTIDIRQ